MAEGRDELGRFVKLPGPGRPPGALNVVTKTLREKVLAGFDDPDNVTGSDGVTDFVRELRKTYPAAAAGLLARMLPPSETEPPADYVPMAVNIVEVPSGTFIPLEQARAQIRQLENLDDHDLPIIDVDPLPIVEVDPQPIESEPVAEVKVELAPQPQPRPVVVEPIPQPRPVVVQSDEKPGVDSARWG